MASLMQAFVVMSSVILYTLTYMTTSPDHGDEEISMGDEKSISPRSIILPNKFSKISLSFLSD